LTTLFETKRCPCYQSDIAGTFYFV